MGEWEGFLGGIWMGGVKEGYIDRWVYDMSYASEYLSRHVGCPWTAGVTYITCV